jgi:serine protease Do
MKVWLLAVICGLALGLAAIFDCPADPVDSCVLVYNEGGHGSGSIVDVNCVLTARHVADHNDLTIRTNDGDEYLVVLVVKDPDSDLALLYIDGQFGAEHPFLLFDRTPLHVGDEITVVGTPYEQQLQNCVLTGRVVKVDTDVPEMDSVNVDILDVHAGPGCSGGPVLDRCGRVRSVLTLEIGKLAGAIPVAELN